jgi:hypothetical protein
MPRSSVFCTQFTVYSQEPRHEERMTFEAYDKVGILGQSYDLYG